MYLCMFSLTNFKSFNFHSQSCTFVRGIVSRLPGEHQESNTPVNTHTAKQKKNLEKLKFPFSQVGKVNQDEVQSNKQSRVKIEKTQLTRSGESNIKANKKTVTHVHKYVHIPLLARIQYSTRVVISDSAPLWLIYHRKLL